MTTSNELYSQRGTATIERPRFKPGLLLEDEDLTAGVDYTRNLTRLLFRSLFGCGVICGLGVDAKLCGTRLELSVGLGVALDCLGNAIEVPKSTQVIYDPGCKKLPAEVWVAICYLEKCCRPKDVASCEDDDAQSIYTRVIEGFEVKLFDGPPKCACACPCPKPDPADPKRKCCTQAPAKTTTGANGKTPGCYDDHNNGVCACDCGCTCVVVARIPIEKTVNGQTTTTADANGTLTPCACVVRRIRPVLIGDPRIVALQAKASPEGAAAPQNPPQAAPQDNPPVEAPPGNGPA